MTLTDTQKTVWINELGRCRRCKFYAGNDFCHLLPWNDPTYNSALAKYIGWHGEPCPELTTRAVAVIASEAKQSREVTT